MSSYIYYILVGVVTLYYLGISIYVTFLAVRSGKLKHFREVNPEDITVLFGSIDSLDKKPKPAAEES